MEGRMPTFKQDAPAVVCMSVWVSKTLLMSLPTGTRCSFRRVLYLVLADSLTSSWFTHLDAFALALIRNSKLFLTVENNRSTAPMYIHVLHNFVLNEPAMVVRLMLFMNTKRNLIRF